MSVTPVRQYHHARIILLVVTPGDCFKHLWERAERELGPPAKRAVVYHVKPAMAFDEEGLCKRDNDLPKIVLYRRDRTPPSAQDPDLLTQPVQDACILAHEFGHFLSDPTDRLHPVYERARAGQPLTPEEKGHIVAEEEKAWNLGRAALADLGCNEWGEFERLRDRGLRTYREGLAKVPEK